MSDKWLVYGGGPSVKTREKQIKEFVDNVDLTEIATNVVPDWVNPKYHLICNRKNLKRYRKYVKKSSIFVGTQKITDADYYFEVKSKYPSNNGGFEVENGKVFLEGATAAMYAAAFAIYKNADIVYFVGLDGYPNKNETHWYRNEPNYKRCLWQQEATKGILSDMEKYAKIKILTPTVYEEWYEPF